MGPWCILIYRNLALLITVYNKSSLSLDGNSNLFEEVFKRKIIRKKNLYLEPCDLRMGSQQST